jgi:GTP cyclohydrolase I
MDDNPHLRRTPERFVKMLTDLTEPDEINLTVFPSEGVDEMVLVSPISFHSLCSHHVVPFIGKAHVAYVPKRMLVGLSKIPRVVKGYSKGLWDQENLTATIANVLDDALDPVGVAVVMEAEHLCMTIRGVKEHGAKTTTSAMRGCFIDPTKQARQEFLRLITRNGG